MHKSPVELPPLHLLPFAVVWSSPGEASTRQLGRALSGVVQGGDIIFLVGPLGAGKTTLTRELIEALCPGEEVTSPSYVVENIYDCKEIVLEKAGPDKTGPDKAGPDQTVPRTIRRIHHIDLYRVGGSPPEDLVTGMLYPEESVIYIVEWPEPLGERGVRPSFVVDFAEGDESAGTKYPAPEDEAPQYGDRYGDRYGDEERRITVFSSRELSL